MSSEIRTLVSRSRSLTFNAGSPAVGDQNTIFPFVFDYTIPAPRPVIPPYTNAPNIGQGIFTAYARPLGSVVPAWLFPRNSNIIIQNVKCSIPNLRGIKHVEKVLEEYVISIIAIGLRPVGSTPSTLGTLAFTKTLTDFEETKPFQQQVASPQQTEDFYLCCQSADIGLDTRNIQAIYNGISIFLQVEIQIIAPLGILVESLV